MTVSMVERYVVKLGKQGELMLLLQQMGEYKEENSKKTRSLNSKPPLS